MNQKLTYLEAIEIVLRESDRPLSTKEIKTRLEKSKLRKFDNRQKTPEKTIASRIGEEIDTNGEYSTFVRVGLGRYALREKVEQRSFFLVIEGLDGSGKTEIASRLAEALVKIPGQTVLLTFEPHDPSLGGYYIRQVLDKEEKIKRVKQVRSVLPLAFAANRADHYKRVIAPFLEDETRDKRICICDRYYLSSIVYQSESDDEAAFKKVMSLNSTVRNPDLTIFLDIDANTGYQRIRHRREDKDLFEKNLKETKEKYNKAISFLKKTTGEKIEKVNANKEISEVLNSIGKILTGPLGPGWIDFQTQILVEEKIDFFLINENFDLQIPGFAEAFVPSWGSLFIHGEGGGNTRFTQNRNRIVDAVDGFKYQEISSLFISYLQMNGFIVGDQKTWSDLDAISLEYPFPEGNTLKGIGIIVAGYNKQSDITRKVLDLQQPLDFIAILDLRKSQFVKGYTRDPIVDGENKLFPLTIVIDREKISDMVVATSLLMYVIEHYHEHQRLRPIYTKVLESHKLRGQWAAAYNYLSPRVGPSDNIGFKVISET